MNHPYKTIRKELIVAAALAALALLIAGLFSHAQKPLALAEVQFADQSAHGLSIVPASCPSDPHFAGECGPRPVCPIVGPCVCPAGYNVQGNQCVPNGCPPGYTQDSKVCVPIPNPTSCPPGYTLQNGQCVVTSCPAGYSLQNGQCVLTSCPAGFTLQNGQCVANQCGPQFFCSGSDVYQHVNSLTCSATLYQRCPYGCSSGACVGAPSPDIVTWNVRPLLVQQGTSVRVTWEARNVASCAVRGTNGDGSGSNATGVWNTFSGDKTTSPIRQQTTYTITCQALDGASPSTISRSSTVNIVPVFQEK